MKSSSDSVVHGMVTQMLMLLLVLMLPAETIFAATSEGREGKEETSKAVESSSPTTGLPLPHQGVRRLNDATKDWLRIGGEIRLRGEGRTAIGYRAGNDDHYFLSRVRVHLDFFPQPWFRAFLEGQDSRAPGLGPVGNRAVFENTFDLRQAYVDLFHRKNKGMGLQLGRQELSFGEERLLGPLNWTNTARTFDAVRLYLDNGWIRVDGFAAALVGIQENVFDKRVKGDRMYGTYATFPGSLPGGGVEVYAIWRAQSQVTNELGGREDADRITFGTRFTGSSEVLSYGVELVGQQGNVAGDDAGAWAYHMQVGYTMMETRSRPVFIAEYNFASGDDDPHDGRVGTFDQLFPTNHNKYGVMDQVGWRNVHNLRMGVAVTPVPRFKLNVDYHSFWLANRRDAFYNAGGGVVARVSQGAKNGHVGQEVDVYGSANLGSRFTAGLGWGRLFAGDFLKEATAGESSGFWYLMLGYRF